MLVLTRKAKETIQLTIAPSTTETIIEIHVLKFFVPYRTRLGLVAPASVRIMRTEILERNPPDEGAV